MRPEAAIPPDERWWVVFCDNNPWGFWRLFTKPGNRHCFAFRQLTEGAVLFVEPLLQRATVHILNVSVPHLLRDYLGVGYQVYVVELKGTAYHPRMLPRRGPVITCASFVAYHLGLQGWIVTPQGLRAHIETLAARRITGEMLDWLPSQT